MGDVIALIVTYNPELGRFRRVLESALSQASRVIIIDNASSNADSIRELCRGACEFLEVGFNSGVAHALKIGVRHASRYDAEWLLFLDDDTILFEGAVDKALHMVNELPAPIRERVGSVLLGRDNGNCGIKELRYGEFSGVLVRPAVALRTCCRDDFFLDQADFDMYAKIRRLGYLTLVIDCKLKDHEVGGKKWIKILRRWAGYESPWRYYYIARNSTVLLREGAMDLLYYVTQLLIYGIYVLSVDGVKAFIKPLGLGILHALLGELGYLDRKHFDNS